MNYLHKAGGLLIRDRKFLLERHGGNATYIVPGGKLAAGETAIAALIRECDEEFHIVISENKVQYVGSFASRAVHNPDKIVKIETFWVKTWKGEISLDDGIEQIIWVDSKTIADYPVSSIAKNNVLPLLLEMQLID